MKDGGNKDPIKSTTFLWMRSKPSFYKIFLRCFVKQVVGVFEWNDKIRNSSISHDKIFTPSDEAFALLLIENSEKRWLDIFKKNNYQVPTPRKQSIDGKQKVVISDVKPRYTEGGIKYSNQEESKSKGWSKEGIIRFNTLHQKVKDDRKKHPDFNKSFREEELQILENESFNQSLPNKKRKIVVFAARDCIWDNDDEGLQVIDGNAQDTNAAVDESRDTIDSSDEEPDLPPPGFDLTNTVQV